MLSLVCRLLVIVPALAAPDPLLWQRAVQTAQVRETQAQVVVLELSSGRLLAAERLQQAATQVATPGSTLKPFLLFQAVRAGRWNPAGRIACSRTLRIAGHRLGCAHPQMAPMDAEQALTWSCNTYFASLAGAWKSEELQQALSGFGLLGATGLAAGERTAEFHRPQSPEQLRLSALGVEGVRVTLLELAAGYRHLELEMERNPESAAARTVRNGLANSASVGMAGAASTAGVSVAGKTGTAESAPGSSTHGWFVGFAPAAEPRVVIAVYVPNGHGAAAASVAASVLARSPLAHAPLAHAGSAGR